MIVVLAIDALEYDLVEKFNCKNLKQKYYGKTDISEFSKPKTMVLWSSFMTGENKEKEVIAEGDKEMWDKKFDIKDTFFSKFENPVIFDLPGFNYDKSFHDKSRLLLKKFFEAKSDEERRNVREEYNKEAFDHHRKIKENFFNALNEKHDFILAYFSLVDLIGHLNFGNMLLMRMIYKEIDDIAKEIKEKTKGHVLIISDHGMKTTGMLGDHSDYGFWSFNIDLKIKEQPKITELHDVILSLKDEVKTKTIKTKAKKLREMFSANELIRIVGAHDGLTAKLVEKNGFEGVWASGLEISTSHGVPDANILTMSDHLHQASDMNDVVSIPVVVDCDTGYGNSNNVIQMVKKFEAAGIAAVCIEDKKFPKSNSLLKDGRQDLAPIAEFVGKIMAAKNAQKSKDFMVFARVEALIAGWGMEEALKRAHAYIDAGADGIFIHSRLKYPSKIIEFCKKWNKRAPLVLCPTNYPSLKEMEMNDLGAKMAIYANHGIRSSIKAINETFQQISKEGIVNIDSKIAPLKEVFELQGLQMMREHEKKFLKTDTRSNINTVILAAGASGDKELKDLFGETPTVMLDINGKSILQRNVETLKKAGISHINVVTGYETDKVQCDGINKIFNKDYKTTWILHSMFKAEEHLNGKTLLTYGDTIFDNVLLNKLLDAEGDIVLVIDGTYKTSKYRNKKLDLVIAKQDTLSGPRRIDIQRKNHILKIGKSVDENKANFEFIGMILFSEKGIKDFKDAYYKLKNEYQPGKFHGIETFDKAAFTDLIQEMIDNGYKIGSLEVNSGWSEIHTFNDYKRVCKMMAE